MFGFLFQKNFPKKKKKKMRIAKNGIKAFVESLFFGYSVIYFKNFFQFLWQYHIFFIISFLLFVFFSALITNILERINRHLASTYSILCISPWICLLVVVAYLLNLFKERKILNSYFTICN